MPKFKILDEVTFPPVALLSMFKLKSTTIIIFIVVIFCQNAYSFEYNGLGVSLMNFFNSLSFKYNEFDIKLKGGLISEEFDNNVTYTKRNKTEDYISNMGLGVGMKYEGKTGTVELTTNITNQIFAKNNDFNNVTEDVTLQLKSEFSEQSRIDFKNTFTHSDAPLFAIFPQSFFAHPGQLGAVGLEYFQNRINIDYSNDVTKQLTVATRYASVVDSFSINESSGVRLRDSFQNKAGFEADYLFSPDTTFLFSYDFTNRQFEDKGHATIHAVTSGIRQAITERLNFNGSTGLDVIDSFGGGDLIRPVGQASFTYDMDERTSVLLLFVKNYETTTYTENIYNSWRTSVSFTRQLSERLNASLLLFYGKDEYIPAEFKIRGMGASPSFTYDINKNVKGSIRYSYVQSDSDIETVGYTKSIVFLGLTAEF